MSEQATERLSNEVARLDFERAQRIAMPEAILCESKSTEQVVAIIDAMLERGISPTIATRTTQDQRDALANRRPQATQGRLLVWNPAPPTGRTIAVVAAGTSDLDVADEAAGVAEALGHNVVRRTDVGVAGLHRLLGVIEDLEDADVIIAIAGMEGALPTVLAGLVANPIIAVPTSVGYGTSYQGVTALLSMMTSCGPGVTVVNIDNGYGAASAAHRIATMITRRSPQ